MTIERIFDNPSNRTMITPYRKPAPFMWMEENEIIGIFHKFGTSVLAAL